MKICIALKLALCCFVTLAAMPAAMQREVLARDQREFAAPTAQGGLIESRDGAIPSSPSAINLNETDAEIGRMNARDPNSVKGRFVLYDFDKAFGASNWLVTGRSQQSVPLQASAAPPPPRPVCSGAGRCWHV